METSGQRIQRARVRRGLSVEQLARAAEVGALSLMCAEDDTRPLDLDDLERVAAELGVDATELLPGGAAERRAMRIAEYARDAIDPMLSSWVRDDVERA